MSIRAIAAIGRNRELGKGNELLWRIPDDLKRVRTLTMGHPLIMGRKTYDSIIAAVGKPLPGRTSIVITRSLEKEVGDFTTRYSRSIEEALSLAQQAPGADEIFIFGGAQIYALALPFTEELDLTLIDDTKDADSFFPEYENEFPRVVSEEVREHEGLRYRWIDLKR